jgi:hypothetical protein
MPGIRGLAIGGGRLEVSKRFFFLKKRRKKLFSRFGVLVALAYAHTANFQSPRTRMAVLTADFYQSAWALTLQTRHAGVRRHDVQLQRVSLKVSC